MRCIYGVFGKGIAQCTIIYGAHIWFWLTLRILLFKCVYLCVFTALANPTCPAVCVCAFVCACAERVGLNNSNASDLPHAGRGVERGKHSIQLPSEMDIW